jgi:hypothetical protein
MHNNHAQVCVGSAGFPRESTRDGLDIQRMSNAGTFDLRQAGDPRAILPLIHGDGIDDVGIYAGGLREAKSEWGSEIAGMLASARKAEFFDESIVDEVRPASHRRQQSSASAYRRKVLRIVAPGSQRFLNQRGTIAGSRQHRAPSKLVNFLVAVVHRTRPYRAFSVENTELSGGRARIDDEDAVVTLVWHGILPCHATLFAIPEFE